MIHFLLVSDKLCQIGNDRNVSSTIRLLFTSLYFDIMIVIFHLKYQYERCLLCLNGISLTDTSRHTHTNLSNVTISPSHNILIMYSVMQNVLYKHKAYTFTRERLLLWTGKRLIQVLLTSGWHTLSLNILTSFWWVLGFGNVRRFSVMTTRGGGVRLGSFTTTTCSGFNNVAWNTEIVSKKLYTQF